MNAVAFVFMALHGLLIRPGWEAVISNVNQHWFWASSAGISALILIIGILHIFRSKKDPAARAVLIVISAVVALAGACCFAAVALICLSVNSYAYSWREIAWVFAQGGGIGLASIFIAPSRLMRQVQ